MFRYTSAHSQKVLQQSFPRRRMSLQQNPVYTPAVLDTLTSMARPAPQTSAAILFRATSLPIRFLKTKNNGNDDSAFRSTADATNTNEALPKQDTNSESESCITGARSIIGLSLHPTMPNSQDPNNIHNVGGGTSSASSTVHPKHASKELSDILLTLRDGSHLPFHYLPLHRQNALLSALQKDPSVSSTWLSLAKLLEIGETVTVLEKRYTSTLCCVEAVALDPHSAEAWFELGLRLGDRKKVQIPLPASVAETTTQQISHDDTISNSNIVESSVSSCEVDRTACYAKAVSIDPRTKLYWNHLAIHLKNDETVVLHGQEMSEIDCYTASIEMDASSAVEWFTLSRLLAVNEAAGYPFHHPTRRSQVLIHGQLYNAKNCLVEVLSRDFSATMAWFHLAEALGGGQSSLDEIVYINGKSYNRLQCCVKAAERDPSLSLVWYHLGKCLKALELETQGQEFSSPQQMMKQSEGAGGGTSAKSAPSLNPPLQPPPTGNAALTVTVEDRRLTRQQCFAEAIKRDASHAAAWAELAETLVTIHHRMLISKTRSVTSRECLVEALSLDGGNERYWHRLAIVLTEVDRHNSNPNNNTSSKSHSVSKSGAAAGGGNKILNSTSSAAASSTSSNTQAISTAVSNSVPAAPPASVMIHNVPYIARDCFGMVEKLSNY